MVDTDKIRGLMAEKGLTQECMAQKLGIHSKTFGIKMRNRVFLSSEMEEMVNILGIKNPAEIFFASLSPNTRQN